MSGPLHGIRVIDFTTLLPGPLATLLLSEAGAEVIKIEKPGSGEQMRSQEPKWGSESVSFSLLNRGKKSLAIDIKNPEKKQQLLKLCKTADVLVEQFRPGVMARLGFDYKSLSKLNPQLVYCSISGYGQTGPKSSVAGHDLNYIGDTGLLSLSMGVSDSPVIPPALIGDIAGGSYPSIINILLALRERDETNRGCHLDVSMTDNLFPLLFWAIGNNLVTGESPRNGSELFTGGSPRYQLYPTSDNRFVAAAPLEQKFWEAFVKAIGLDVELHDDALAPINTKKEVAKIIREHPASYWEQRLGEADCCCSIVRTFGEALTDRHFIERGLYSHTLLSHAGDSISALPIPIAARFRDDRGKALSAPALGENNAELTS
tara:strand:- start:297 stop:1418 length:1122 start_codon:yes stop_codon:yes gene_type:complete